LEHAVSTAVLERTPVRTLDGDPYPRFIKRRTGWRPSADAIESGALFVVFLVAYLALGYRLVVEQHLVVFDALSRLAHANFVWYNSPPKLAAVGFVWPPGQTLAFLPFAAIKPLASSLLALPATSGLFAAGMLVMLNRTLDVMKMARWQRYPLLLAFGLNPMVVFYAINGMSETTYLFFLVGAVHFFLRWFLTGQAHVLVLAGTMVALGFLSRYEMLVWGLLLAGAIPAVLLRRRATGHEIEGSLLAFLAPVVYGGMLWVFFNWLILGSPLAFLHGGVVGGLVTQGGGPAAGTTLAASGAAGHGLSALGDSVSKVASLNWQLFPFAVVVVGALAVTALARRDLMALVLIAVVSLNALLTTILFWRSHKDFNLLQLRYNMRAMPLALIAAGWLFLAWNRSWARTAIAVAAFAGLLASMPATWHAMSSYRQQYEEQAFLRALTTGSDQDGTFSRGGYPVGDFGERNMASLIKPLIRHPKEIITDDAQSLGVMLASGHPEWFVDRIDRGDRYWLRRIANPWGHVRYVLMATAKRCRPPGCVDLAREHYPLTLVNRQPGMTIVAATDLFVLARVAAHAPRSSQPTTLAPPSSRRSDGVRRPPASGDRSAPRRP
jgi:hypothetical protein